ncbi:radical SAM protein [Achromatium sp. WMS1]|nr:radical SAM protein [Achromatium sp. WMS1]
MMQQISYRIADRLYLSITDRCTLVCAFCPKTQGSKLVHDYDLTMQFRPNTEQIIAAIDDPINYEEIVFCGYGEPTLRLNTLLAVATYIKQHGGRVRVNTDGLANLVHKKPVLPALGQWVDAVSVSLNAQNESIYQHHCQPNLPGSYHAMLDFLRQAPKFIPNVTATAIDGLAGVDIKACEQLANSLGVKFRRRTLGIVG